MFESKSAFLALFLCPLLLEGFYVILLSTKTGVILLARRRIVDEQEVVKILSDIARGDVGEESVKVSERLKAVELLGRRYDLFGSRDETQAGDIRVVVDYVGKSDA